MTPQALGGIATKELSPPARCPRCGASMRGRSWHSYLGHKGMHGLADRAFAGNVSAAARQMAKNALARAENGATWANGAWLGAYKPLIPYRRLEKATVKTDFGKIKFNESWHKYYYENRELVSVTTRLKDVQKPFDREGIAARSAAKNGKTVEEVLAEWDAKGEAARTLGTAVHAHIEKVLKGQLDPRQIDFDGFLSLNTKLPEIAAFDDAWRKLAPIIDISLDCVEWVIGDAELGIAGTLDTLLLSKEDSKYHIFDWKTGSFDLDNKWENLLPPFDHLSASKFHIYSLQVSLYRLILERNTDLPMGDGYLVHLANDGSYHIHRAVDLRLPLLNWLKKGVQNGR